MSTQQPKDRGEAGLGRAVPRGAELRRAARNLTTQKAVVYPYLDPAGGTKIPGWACDVSAIGVGLILEKPLPPGREFLIHIGTRPGPAGKLLYSVVHCHVCGERYHRIGAELVAVLLDPAEGAAGPSGDVRDVRELRDSRGSRGSRGSGESREPRGANPAGAAVVVPSAEMVQRIRYAVLG